MLFSEYTALKALGKVTLVKQPDGRIFAYVDRSEHLELSKPDLIAARDDAQATLDNLKTLKADIDALP